MTEADHCHLLPSLLDLKQWLGQLGVPVSPDCLKDMICATLSPCFHAVLLFPFPPLAACQCKEQKQQPQLGKGDWSLNSILAIPKVVKSNRALLLQARDEMGQDKRRKATIFP